MDEHEIETLITAANAGDIDAHEALLALSEAALAELAGFDYEGGEVGL